MDYIHRMHNTNVLLFFLHMYVVYILWTHTVFSIHLVWQTLNLTNISDFFPLLLYICTPYMRLLCTAFFYYISLDASRHTIHICMLYSSLTLTVRCYFPFVCDMTTIYSLYIWKCFVYGISLCSPLSFESILCCSRVWCCLPNSFCLCDCIIYIYACQFFSILPSALARFWNLRGSFTLEFYLLSSTHCL